MDVANTFTKKVLVEKHYLGMKRTVLITGSSSVHFWYNNFIGHTYCVVDHGFKSSNDYMYHVVNAPNGEIIYKTDCELIQ